MTENQSSPENPERRSLMQQALAALVGALVSAVPILSGLVMWLDPLGKKGSAGQWVAIAPLGSVPPDGKPYRFPVIADRRDAWNFYPPEPIGAVYLRRTSETQTPVAFSSVCPHLGCAVDFQPGSDRYFCPCHNSTFAVDGSRTNPESSPSPRDLDSLEVKVEDGQVLVQYLRFQGGKSKKMIDA